MTGVVMSPMRIGLATLAGLAFAIVAPAQVTIAFGAGTLNNSGGTPLPTGTLVILVADTQNNGFGTLSTGSLTVGSLLNGDDQVLFRATINISDPQGSVQDILSNASFTGNWNAGDALALIWLPGLTSASNTFSNGQSYGLFTTTSPAAGDPWVTPTSGSLGISLSFATQMGGGTYANSLGNASLTAIPEPSTYAAITGAAMLGLAAWRRRFQRTET